MDCDKIISATKSLKYPSLSLPFQLSVLSQIPLPKSLSLPTFMKECDDASKHSGVPAMCQVPFLPTDM